MSNEEELFHKMSELSKQLRLDTDEMRHMLAQLSNMNIQSGAFDQLLEKRNAELKRQLSITDKIIRQALDEHELLVLDRAIAQIQGILDAKRQLRATAFLRATGRRWV